MGSIKGSDDFEGRIAEWFRLQNLDMRLPSLVAFSGGPDSTVLLAVLTALGAGPLRAVYIDHGIRQAAEREAERQLVAATAHGLGVDLEIRDIQEGRVGAFAREKGIGIEAAARKFRKEALRSVALAFGAGRIYVGHTRDDNLEGLLMRFLRGSGTAGLRGLRGVDGLIARPLLEVGRADVLAYLSSRGLQASIDSTNSDEDILRNRVRRRILPLLDGEFPGWRGGTLRSAGRLALDDEALGLLASQVETQKASDGSLLIRWDLFVSLPKGLRFRILAKAIDDLVENDVCSEFPGARIPARMLEAILESIASDRSFSGHGLSIYRNGPFLKVGPSLDFEEGDGYFVVLNESDIGFEGSVPGGFALVWSDERDKVGIPEGSFDFPLIVRTRRPGDSIALLTGSRRVDRLVSDWGLEPSFKNRVPVIQDRRGLLAVLGSAVPRGKDVIRIDNSGAPNRRLLSLRLKGA